MRVLWRALYRPAPWVKFQPTTKISFRVQHLLYFSVKTVQRRRDEIITAVSRNFKAFCDVTPCSFEVQSFLNTEVYSSEMLVSTQPHSITSQKTLILADRPASYTSPLHVVQLRSKFQLNTFLNTYYTVVFIHSLQQCSEPCPVEVPTPWSHNETLPSSVS
jgi:hypothetical protein